MIYNNTIYVSEIILYLHVVINTAFKWSNGETPPRDMWTPSEPSHGGTRVRYRYVTILKS